MWSVKPNVHARIAQLRAERASYGLPGLHDQAQRAYAWMWDKKEDNAELQRLEELVRASREKRP
jgi:hypothetical protein